MRATAAAAPLLITHQDPGAAASEAFRVLRTNLQFMGLDKPLKSIMVTSATPSEGKSTVAANLAVAFAQAGSRVCLVDADLRRPMVAKTLGLTNYAGLTTALISQEGLEGHLQETDIPGLTVLASGPVPPNPAELLATKRMNTLLAQLEEQFDMVIVDSAPVLAVTDAAVVAPKVGGTLLVVRAGQTPRQEARLAKEALEAVKANVLGVVLGAIKAEGHQGYYYYDYGASGTEQQPYKKRKR
ncbi:MAG: CpsD/CapB family tyrosine-protein kinase [Mycobacterium leprae]